MSHAQTCYVRPLVTYQLSRRVRGRAAALRPMAGVLRHLPCEGATVLQLHDAAARLYGALAKLYYQVNIAACPSWCGFCPSLMVCQRFPNRHSAVPRPCSTRLAPRACWPVFHGLLSCRHTVSNAAGPFLCFPYAAATPLPPPSYLRTVWREGTRPREPPCLRLRLP